MGILHRSARASVDTPSPPTYRIHINTIYAYTHTVDIKIDPDEICNILSAQRSEPRL